MDNLAEVLAQHPTPWKGIEYFYDFSRVSVADANDDPIGEIIEAEPGVAQTMVKAVNILADVRRAALEQACQAVCDGCAGGRTVENIRGKWWHPIIEHDGYYTPPMPCMASAIRDLMDAPSGQGDDRYDFRRARGAIPYREGQPMPEDVIRRMRGKDDDEEEDDWYFDANEREPLRYEPM